MGRRCRGALTTFVVVTASCGAGPDPNLAVDDSRSGPHTTVDRAEEPEGSGGPIVSARPTGSVPLSSPGATNETVADVTDRSTVSTDPVAPSTTTRPDRSATLAFTGDTLTHSPLWRRAQADAGGTGYDFFPMFSDIAPIVRAVDLAVCHLETPIAPEGEEFSTFPLYGVPPEIVSAMATAGFDRCSTASNHVLDRRVAGIDRTIEVLESNGMGQSGMARDEAESRPSVFEVGDIAMSHLSYTFSTNGLPIPSDEPWRTNLIDPDRVIADAQTARDLGAEFVFVSMHWGTEGVTAPNAQQIDVAEAITASGEIDLVIGHHAHVLQPIEQVNGVWVVYGLGNILSNLPVNTTWPAATQDSAIAEFTITVDAGGVVTVERPVVRPTWVDKTDGWVIRDVATSLADPTITDGDRGELERSNARTSGVVGDFIAFDPGPPDPVRGERTAPR